jgi:hypothetical protein
MRALLAEYFLSVRFCMVWLFCPYVVKSLHFCVVTLGIWCFWVWLFNGDIFLHYAMSLSKTGILDDFVAVVYLLAVCSSY